MVVVMTADVGSLGRITKENQRLFLVNETSGGGGGGKSTVPMTRDFLGGGDGGERCRTTSTTTTFESKELDLNLHVPSGWKKRLNLESGKVYVQRCNSPGTSSSSSEAKHQTNRPLPKLQDLNFSLLSKKPLSLFEDNSLDLKLVPLSSSNYPSVCTLEKVKSALERAKRETNKKRSMPMSNFSSSSSAASSNSSTSLMKVPEIEFEEKSSSSIAAGCPSCLLYVLISKSNPKCPRCKVTVPLPMTFKKPRIDLNISI